MSTKEPERLARSEKERSRAVEVCRRERDGRLTVIGDGYSLPIVSSQSWIALWKPTHSSSSAAAGWSDLVKI